MAYVFNTRDMFFFPREDIFNEKERAVYNGWIANSLDPTLSRGQQNIHKRNADLKLKLSLSRGRREDFLTSDDLSESNLQKVFNEKERKQM